VKSDKNFVFQAPWLLMHVLSHTALLKTKFLSDFTEAELDATGAAAGRRTPSVGDARSAAAW